MDSNLTRTGKKTHPLPIPLRILVVEDHPADAELIKENLLESFGPEIQFYVRAACAHRETDG